MMSKMVPCDDPRLTVTGRWVRDQYYAKKIGPFLWRGEAHGEGEPGPAVGPHIVTKLGLSRKQALNRARRAMAKQKCDPAWAWRYEHQRVKLVRRCDPYCNRGSCH